MKLFSTSGIRRKVADLPPEFVVKVGLAISESLCNDKNSKVLLGRDARLSGPQLEHAISAGLLAGGCSVEHLGIVPTPALAYHTYKLKANAGVMLTASHNPPEYNGIKVFDKTGMGLSPEDEMKIEKAYFAELKPVSWEKIGNDHQNYGAELYHKMLLDAGGAIDDKYFDAVIADPGGGAGCQVINETYNELGLNLVMINALFDPFFSARLSEPVPKNLTELISLVQKRAKSKSERVIGLAYDGDADRCVAIDEKGRYVPQDVLIALYSQYVVEQNNNKGLIITHIDASMLIERLVGKAGGIVKRTKVGDVAIGNMVAKEKALFGGEPCGAWIHPKQHLCPDGPLTGLKILAWIAERGPLYKLVDEVHDFPVQRTIIACDNELKNEVMQKIDETISTKNKIKEILKIDGLRITFEDDSWVLIRPSGTEPIIRITSQATTKEDVESQLEYYSQVIKKVIKQLK